MVEDDAKQQGHRSLRRTFKFRPAEKDRDGRANVPRRVAVESEKDDASRLLWMTVTDEGPIADEGAEDHASAAVLGTLRDADGDGAVARRELAGAAGEKNPSEPSGTFKRALAALIDADKVETVGRRYRITAEGRDAAGLPL